MVMSVLMISSYVCVDVRACEWEMKKEIFRNREEKREEENCVCRVAVRRVVCRESGWEEGRGEKNETQINRVIKRWKE